MPKLLTALFIFLCFRSHAQLEASVWYFGKYAGLDFRQGSPTFLLDSRMETTEGVSTLCDANGQLLFYTDGSYVWNRNHQLMPNGTGLFGDPSSTQSAVTVPFINDPEKFYIFTINEQANGIGFHYSVVDMAQQNGTGAVVQKNVFLKSLVCEKITAVKHCNGRDIWVIIHGFGNADFYAYLVTSSGVSTTPVISTAGRIVTTTVTYAIGCMKASPNGKKLVAAHLGLGVDLLDFDNTTGVISNAISVFSSTEPYHFMPGAYGVEFSPDSKLFYVCGEYWHQAAFQTRSFLFQYDALVTDHAALVSSRIPLWDQLAEGTQVFGTLQNAPDGKMYMAETVKNSISVINSPNLRGIACNFSQGTVVLSNGGPGAPSSRLGLPAFIQSYLRPSFNFTGACAGNLIQFNFEPSEGDLSVKWDFGDPASGPANTSVQNNPSHLFSVNGSYEVQLIRYTSCGSDTVRKNILAGAGQVRLGRDTLLCDASSYQIIPQVTGPVASYRWQDGSSSTMYTATQPGLYWVETTAPNGCVSRDSIQLQFGRVPVFDLGADRDICTGQTVTLSTTATGAYTWSNGSTGNSLTTSNAGLYWLAINDNGCIKRDTVTIAVYDYPVVNLGNDTTLCDNELLLLQVQQTGLPYTWQDNSSAATFTVQSPGSYWVKVNNHGCSSADTIQVRYNYTPVFSLGPDLVICEGLVKTIQPIITKGAEIDYLWSTGSVAPTLQISTEGLYQLELTNHCGSQTDAVNVVKGNCLLLVPTGFTPNGDGLNDEFKAMFGDNVTQFEIIVYNRWGEIVFRSTDISKGWNGTFKGLKQDTGVFAWTVRFKTFSETKEKILKGTVLLIR